MTNFLSIAAIGLAVVGSARLDNALNSLKPQTEPAAPPEQIIKVEPKPTISCIGCTTAENKTLNFFHSRGVKDHYALAMIMGSIKQESNFKPSVCEGGYITSWAGCTRGGYGLIQFTSSHRYYGLGSYARRIGKAPEDIDTQLKYIVTEREWKSASAIFKQDGLGMPSYDYAGKIWLGYGIKGNRLNYAWQYVSRIS